MPTSHSILPFSNKTPEAIALYNHFINTFLTIGHIEIQPAKTMIGISNGQHRIAWVTAIGKNFMHIVFPFTQSYADNLCFQKIAQVPGDANQFNHHFRMIANDDINDEVKSFMHKAYTGEQH